MGLDLTGARDSYATYLFGDSCTFVRPRLITDGGGSTKPDPDGPQRIGPLTCAFSAVSGDEAAADVIAVRGRYRLKLPLVLLDPESGEEIRDQDTDEIFVPIEGDLVEFQSREYRVVWTPPATALSLKRKLGLTEAR